MPHAEHHFIHRANWLRAAVLGANDGIISTASLLVGVANAGVSDNALVATGIAATLAGALSMAAGEYVSVSSQADTEKADLAREKQALREDRASETEELADIYRARGLDHQLADQVAEQLMAHNALEAHARDELGISHVTNTNPLQAAWSSAGAFSLGSLLPLATAYLAADSTAWWIASASLLALVLLGLISARAGGANLFRATARVVLWGTFAMAATGLAGSLLAAAGLPV
ncbi:VIT1/CCC1 transporter family protein [Simiduia agarivorans]|uniref:Nodulin-related integral membrane protein n=1 Tax=Simiduia agarivorans (strain DSM 21679 / JCM 13881 / BCRC 17597 / SA1) TaxID=1117647 RepID=K4KI53_SIMAS|nr:VIT family protein [Simiduia agarivorans]AFU98676.1 nodulin-related integral membrane protein [Simiduia agarivorans SA1 = DSM 21679]